MSTMERRDIERAAALLADAHQSGSHIDDLPEGLHPADIADLFGEPFSFTFVATGT